NKIAQSITTSCLTVSTSSHSPKKCIATEDATLILMSSSPAMHTEIFWRNIRSTHISRHSRKSIRHLSLICQNCRCFQIQSNERNRVRGEERVITTDSIHCRYYLQRRTQTHGLRQEIG